VDYVICGRNQPCFAKQGDINMMVRTGGRNRTEKEYRDLFKSGFDTARAITSVGELSLMKPCREVESCYSSVGSAAGHSSSR